MTTTERPEVVALAEALHDAGIIEPGGVSAGQWQTFLSALAAKGYVVERADRIERLAEQVAFLRSVVHSGERLNAADEARIAAALAPAQPARGEEPSRVCGCTADSELGAGSICPACRHRDHGKSGCREPIREPA
jgi:hypothetical protein